MLMAAATHTGGSAHSSSSISPPVPSWHPVVLVPNHNHNQHHQQQVLYDPDLATPSPTTPVTAPPPRHNHLRRPAPRCGGKRRRPRPSRKLPTTYISADAASFRRMVHQVTGADDALLLPVPGPAAPGPEELLCRARAAPPSRAGLTTTPTLDTSAFLMLGGGRGGAAHTRPGVSCCYHGSAVAAVDPGAAALQVAPAGSRSSLESWDEDDALF